MTPDVLGPEGPLTETTGALRWLAAPEAWVLVLVIVPLVALAVWWVYRREAGRTTPASRRWLGTLRAGILLLVIALLFHPVYLSSTHRVIKQKLILLVDDSASMQECEPYADPDQRARLAEAAGLAGPEEVAARSRSALVKAVLTHGEPSLLARLAAGFDVRIYAFDSALRRDVALDDLASRGTSTRIGEALAKVTAELVGQPTAAVVLISDGRSNEGPDPAPTVQSLVEMQQLPCALLAVAVGDPTPHRNVALRVVKPAAGQDFLVGDQMPFTVEVQARGFEEPSLALEIEIQDEEQRPLGSRSITVAGADGTRKEVLYVAAETAGWRTFTVRVTPVAGEADTADNQRDVALRIVQKRIKVLYVEGYPRWEYRYLKNALIRDDENFAVHVLLRSAERDFAQERSPDLEPLTRFPARAAELFEYDVVVLGDVPPGGLDETAEEAGRRLEDVARFVAEAGGGLLMLAGETWNPRDYAATPLGAVLPVLPGTPPVAGAEVQPAFRPVRTAAGRVDPILVFSKDPEVNRRIWEDPEDGLPPLYWFAPVERAKPGARVLLVHPALSNRFGPTPLLATQFYGKGRSMFLGLDSLWRWRKYFGDRFFYQFYSQALRYLATTKLYRGNKRFDLFTDKRRYDIGETVRISAGVRDPDFRPAEEPAQTVYWQAPGAPRPEEIQLDRVQRGEYENVILAAQRGRHMLWIKEHPEDEARADETTFEVDITPIEKAEPSADAALLKQLAALAGERGAFALVDELEPALEALAAEPVKYPERTQTRDLWDRWWVLCLITALLAVEWIARKRLRLP
ncbi:MAG: hypothetical protein JXQ29_09135 [Planctomycetes bacterium]|nr:hypothetical protein [Planctomycetota bacterium]